MRVLGVDAYRRGWVGIALGERIEAYAAATIAELVAEAGPVEVIGIDIPIGLSTSDMRSADEQAQLAAGPRRSSVFLTPVRAALHAPTHAEAVEVNRAATGKGVSIQAYGLRAKILEVDAWVPAAPASRRMVRTVSLRWSASGQATRSWKSERPVGKAT